MSDDEREWERTKENKIGWKREVVGEEGRGKGVESVEVGGGVSEKWERREVHVTADRKEEDVTSFFTKIITFRLLVCPETAWLIFISFGSNYSWQCRLSGYVRAIQNFFII